MHQNWLKNVGARCIYSLFCSFQSLVITCFIYELELLKKSMWSFYKDPENIWHKTTNPSPTAFFCYQGKHSSGKYGTAESFKRYKLKFSFNINIKKKKICFLYFRINLRENLTGGSLSIQLKQGDSSLRPARLPDADPVPSSTPPLSPSMTKSWWWSFSSSSSSITALKQPEQIELCRARVQTLASFLTSQRTQVASEPQRLGRICICRKKSLQGKRKKPATEHQKPT